MVWTPDPNEPAAMFEGPVVDNCLAIITRDFKGALDYYYSSDQLPDFDERSLGPLLGNSFPCVSVEPRTNVTEEAADRSHIIEVVRIRVYMMVTADGPVAVTNKILKYVRVMHLVLQNARRDFFTGMSNPFEVVLGFEHAYDVARQTETAIARAAGIEVSVGLRER